MISITDQTNRKVVIANKPLRIISLVPSQTELLVDLGLEKYIVGVTKFCIHPSKIRKSKVIVGGTKNVNIDKIKALNPTIILCNKEENTKEIVLACQKITATHVSNIFTIDDALELMQHYGFMFSCQENASNLISKITVQKKDFKEFIKGKKTLTVAYFIWKKPWMVAANNTFINYLLQLNNLSNYYQNLERYPEVDLEKLSEKNIDLLLLSSEPYPFKEKHITELKEKFSNTKILLVDGEYFSWYGSRLLNAFDYFKKVRQELTL